MLAALALLELLTLCVLASSPYAVKETHPVPQKWARVGPAPHNQHIDLQIGLRQSQFDELERHLYEVSDPSDRRYGQHLSPPEVNDLVKPTEETLKLVQEWLEGNEIHNVYYSPARDWITLSLPIGRAESLLGTKYSVFQHHDDGTRIIRTPQWSLPLHLHAHIDVIQPTNSFFRPNPKAKTTNLVPLKEGERWVQASDSGFELACNTSLVTPTCLRTLYGTITYTPKSAGKNRMGLNNFLGESNNRSDTQLFLQQYRPEAAGAAYEFEVVVIANGSDVQTQRNDTGLKAGAGREGDLDSETMLGIAWPTPLTAYNTGGSPPFLADITTVNNTNEPYLTWVNYVLAQESLPQVISTSYADDEQTVPLSYAKAVCNGFAQLGARGISLFFASGDLGVGTKGKCFTNDGKNTSAFLAAFPSSCPYVTTVGATKFIPEVVATDSVNGFVSGGGFSQYFARPTYQDSAVLPYIQSLGSTFEGLYNTSSRGYPDISAQGYRYATIWNGSIAVLDGTSASTPTVAAIISLVNDALITAGKPPLGFLNPWLYAGGYKTFRDVTNGSAVGCGTDGFPAKEGWDAVTGFGTPYFPSIVKDVVGAGGRLEFLRGWKSAASILVGHWFWVTWTCP